MTTFSCIFNYTCIKSNIRIFNLSCNRSCGSRRQHWLTHFFNNAYLWLLYFTTRPPWIESLCFLPPKSVANLHPVGSYVISKMSGLKQVTSIWTKRFRQAVYLSWTRRVLIPYPVGPHWHWGYTFILACFIKQLMHDHNSQLATVHVSLKPSTYSSNCVTA